MGGAMIDPILAYLLGMIVGVGIMGLLFWVIGK